jgi:hypothetical protein
LTVFFFFFFVGFAPVETGEGVHGGVPTVIDERKLRMV